MTAVIYNRKSTLSEGRSKSMDRQEEWNLADAERYGFGNVIVLNEPEGARGDWWWQDDEGRNHGPFRSELKKLVELIQRPEVGAVIVYKANRLARDNGVADALAKLFRKHGVRLICQGRDTEIDTARGLRQVAIDSAAAAEWREQIKEDIIADHDYKARHGMITRSPTCYGWRSAGPKSLTAIPVWEEIDIVIMIMEWFVYGPEGEGPLNLYQIARRLTDLGIPMSAGVRGRKSNRSKPVVGVDHIKRILSNCMFVARWRHNGEEFPCDRLLVSRDGEPPRTAVPIELYDAVQLNLASRPAKGAKAGCGGRLLAGLVVCGACGRPMHANVRQQSDGTKVERFFCTHRFAHKGECLGTSSASIAVAAVDAWVLQYLAPQISAEMVAMQNRDNDSSLRQRLSVLEGKLSQHRRLESEQLAKLITVLDEEQIAAVAQRLRSERYGLEAEIQELKSKVNKVNAPVAVVDDLRSNNPQLLREALRRTINWIAVTDKGIVVCTRELGYMGAAFRIPPRGVEFRNGGMKPRMNRRELLPAVGALASQQCRGWILNPASFVAGRRRHLDKLALHLSDRELLPV
jgi:DNA invertase Pin-like site-specific DNA recombinase